MIPKMDDMDACRCVFGKFSDASWVDGSPT
jgi:hypothetical protein